MWACLTHLTHTQAHHFSCVSNYREGAREGVSLQPPWYIYSSSTPPPYADLPSVQFRHHAVPIDCQPSGQEALVSARTYQHRPLIRPLISHRRHRCPLDQPGPALLHALPREHALSPPLGTAGRAGADGAWSLLRQSAGLRPARRQHHDLARHYSRRLPHSCWLL